MAFAAFGLTDPGKVRTFNEDAHLVFLYQDVLFLCIADGFGSRPGKDIASVVALREFRMFMERYLSPNPLMGSVQYLMEQAFHVANRAIRSYTLANEEGYSGWGASMTCLAINKTYEMVIGHVGNTRLSVIRGQDFMTLTKDHTETQVEIDLGRLQESERWSHPGRATLTRGLGMTERMGVDMRHDQAQRGDILLLSTDGIHGVLTNQAIMQIIYDAGNTQTAIQNIVEAVKEVGAPDNLAGVLTYCDY